MTRATVIQLARDLGIACAEKRVSLVECYTADAMFTTGTMGELTPVTALDGRVIPSGDNPILRRLQEAYRRLTEREGEPLPPFEEA